VRAVPFELLEDEPLAAEKPRAQPTVEGDPHGDAAGGAEEGVFLAEQPAAMLAQVDRDDLARIGRGERHLLPARAVVAEHGHEQRLAREHPLAGREELAHEPALLRPRAVAEDGLHLDARVHVHERPGLGDAGLARIEDHLHVLEVLAEQLVVDLVRPHPSTKPSAYPGRRGRRRGGGEGPRKLGLGRDRDPVGHALGENVGVAADPAAPDTGDDVVPAHGTLLLAADGHVPGLVTHTASPLKMPQMVAGAYSIQRRATTCVCWKSSKLLSETSTSVREPSARRGPKARPSMLSGMKPARAKS
jgi:hypothetical protein